MIKITLNRKFKEISREYTGVEKLDLEPLIDELVNEIRNNEYKKYLEKGELC